jgi:hypothetical protein
MAADCLIGVSGEVCWLHHQGQKSSKEKYSGYARKHGNGAINKRKLLFTPRSA